MSERAKFYVVTSDNEVEFNLVYLSGSWWVDDYSGEFYSEVFEHEIDAYKALVKSLEDRLCEARAKMEELKEKV